MVIEWLKFRVPGDRREEYLRLDDEIWTPFLKTYPGFISKETWIDPTDEAVVIFVIRWRTREEWFAIPAEALDEVKVRFDAAIAFDYTMEESKEFQVRRFPVL